MENAKWFDRKFDMLFGMERYPEIHQSLQDAPERISQAVHSISEQAAAHKPGGKWSVKEHIGHLIVLEPLWRYRIHDLLEGKPVLTAADLTNKATEEGHFNERSLASLVGQFAAERKESILLFDSVNMNDIQRTSIHPRLQQPMRMIDIAYFTAEHDDHHITALKAIIADKDINKS